MQAGISVNTRNVGAFPNLRYPRYVELAQKLAMHLNTWQVHLIVLDWDLVFGRPCEILRLLEDLQKV